MMKRDYFFRLARAARWYLPPAEAAEVLEDYQELIAQESRDVEELRRDFGSPRSAVRQLVQPRVYRRWLAVFTVLGTCVLLPALTPFWQWLSLNVFMIFHFDWFWWFWWFLHIGERVVSFSEIFFLVGLTLSLAWFWRTSRKEPGGIFLKGILLWLALLLMGMAWLWFMVWLFLGERWELNRIFFSVGQVSIMQLVIGADILAMGLTAFLGLVRARLWNRRWLAVYMLGLTGTVLGLSVWAMMTSLNLSAGPGWQAPLLTRYILLTATGLIGTGVSLC